MTAHPSIRPGVIAIDGPAASGKSTLGRRLAGRMDYRFLDTGLMYRAFTLAALRAGVAAEPGACTELARRLDLHPGSEREARIYLGDEDVTGVLHTPEIDDHVSAYSAIPGVRAVLREKQRAFAAPGGAILAGRDIGEVVLPDADLKFYLEASEAARQSRRQGERSHPEGHGATAAALSSRDRKDAPRTFRAGDAVVIDTTELSLDEVFAKAWEAISCFGG